MMRHLARQHGLVVLAQPPRSLMPWLLRVPRFIQLTLPVPSDDRDFLNALPKDRRSQLRRVMAAGFHAVVSSDSSWAHLFYDRYHQPAVRRSHGDEGYVMSVEEIIDSVVRDGAEFLKIYLGSECVAAGTALQVGDTYHLCRPGWLDGDPIWLRQGVQVARIWFAIQRARQLGCQFLALGGTPPFLNDGVFKFKLRWKPRLDLAGSRWGEHFLLMEPRHPDVQRFLADHPLLASDSQEIGRAHV